MSDYGFKTVKTNKNGDKDTAINAKFPMMGFDMSHRPSSFITFHISDAKTNPIADASNMPGYSSPSLPDVSNLSNLYYGFYDPQGNFQPLLGGANYTYGYKKELIYEYKHGYNFRPACYGTITGTLGLKLTTNAIGTPVAGKYYWNGSLSNSNWNLMTAFNTTTTTDQTAGSFNGNLFPYMNGMKSIFGGALNRHYMSYRLFRTDVPSTSSTKDAVQYGIDHLTLYHFSKDFVGEYPYSFEVDDEYIRIYRTYYWAEFYGRLYFDHTFYDSDSYGSYNWRYEIKDYVRAKIVEQLYGSEIDINIMLFPYKMEDLK